MSYDVINGPIVRSAYKLVKSSSNPFASGEQGFYLDTNGNLQAVNADGSVSPANVRYVKYFENDIVPQNALFAQTGSGAVNLSLQRVSFAAGISATQMDLLGALTVVASTHVSYTLSAAVYTFNGSSLSLASSATQAITVNSSVYTNYSGTRFRSIPLGTWNFTPGEYVFGLMASLNGPAGTTGSFSFFGAQSISVNGIDGNTGNYSQYFVHGLYSAATGAFPASVGYAGINQTGSASTNNALAQPYFRMIAAGA